MSNNSLKFVYWQSSSNKHWYWHLKAGNGQIIANGEGYVNKSDCINAIELVKTSHSAEVIQKNSSLLQ